MAQPSPVGSGSVPRPARRTWRSLQRAERRKLLRLALVRPVASVLLLLLAYFWLPFDAVDDTGTLVGLAVGLLLVLVVLGWQVYGVTRARYPELQAIQAIAVGIPLYLLAFAACYSVLSHALPGSFSEPVTRMGALYFCVTVFATVGFGDIAATTDTTRAVVTVQMVLNLALLAAGLRVLTLAVRMGQARRAGEATEAEEAPPP